MRCFQLISGEPIAGGSVQAIIAGWAQSYRILPGTTGVALRTWPPLAAAVLSKAWSCLGLYCRSVDKVPPLGNLCGSGTARSAAGPEV
jgi:hypothetical protein